MTGPSLFTEWRIALPSASDLDAAARLIHEHGGVVQRFSLTGAPGAARPFERWLAELLAGEFDDVVFLSGQGVRLLVEFARQVDGEEELIRILSQLRKVARGPKALLALRECGLQADLHSPLMGLDKLCDTLDTLDLRARVVGVVPSDREGVVVAALTRKGAIVRALAHSNEIDAEAAQLIDALLGHALEAIVWSSPVQIERLWEVVRARGQLAELEAALSACRVVAIGAAVALELGQRGVRIDAEVERSSFVRPRLRDLESVFGRIVNTPNPSTTAASVAAE
jgi:uroporphyrinogen-III synthase